MFTTGAIRTDDTVAELVIEYATLLAQHGTADTVRIPTLDDEDTVHEAALVIGPASQILLTDERPRPDGRAVRLEVATVEAELRRRIARLRPAPPTEDPWDDMFPAFDGS